MSKKGIRFKGNIKTELKNLEEGELVYAIDTNEWGLCTRENDFQNSIEEIILWRTHERYNQERNISRGDTTPPNSVGSFGHYFINTSESKIYQYTNAGWEEVPMALPQTDFDYLEIITPIDYSDTLKKDGSVLFTDHSEVDPLRVVTVSDVNHQMQHLKKDNTNVMDDNLVSEDGQVIFRKATVDLSVSTTYTEEGELYWDSATQQLKVGQ